MCEWLLRLAPCAAPLLAMMPCVLHTYLLLVRRRLEDLLNIPSHVQLLQHLIALIQDKVLDALCEELLLAD